MPCLIHRSLKGDANDTHCTYLVVCSTDFGQSNIQGRHDFAVDFEHSFPKLDKCSKNDGPYWMSKEEKLKRKKML